MGEENYVPNNRFRSRRKQTFSVVDKEGNDDRYPAQRGQESRSRFEPSLVPEHDSIPLYRFKEDIAQSHRGNFYRDCL